MNVSRCITPRALLTPLSTPVTDLRGIAALCVRAVRPGCTPALMSSVRGPSADVYKTTKLECRRGQRRPSQQTPRVSTPGHRQQARRGHAPIRRQLLSTQRAELAVDAQGAAGASAALTHTNRAAPARPAPGLGHHPAAARGCRTPAIPQTVAQIPAAEVTAVAACSRLAVEAAVEVARVARLVR